MNRTSPYWIPISEEIYGNTWLPKSIQEYAKGPCGGTCSYIFCFGRIDYYLGWNCSHGTWYIPKQLPRNYNGIDEPTMLNTRCWADIVDDDS
jgi:hypothetical protein